MIFGIISLSVMDYRLHIRPVTKFSVYASSDNCQIPSSSTVMSLFLVQFIMLDFVNIVIPVCVINLRFVTQKSLDTDGLSLSRQTF